MPLDNQEKLSKIMNQDNQDSFDDLLNPSEAVNAPADIQAGNDTKNQQNPPVLQAITPISTNVVKPSDEINTTRSKLATRLLWLNVAVVAGIAIFVGVDLWASKSLAWRLIEKLTEPVTPISAPQQTSSSNTATPTIPNVLDKSAETAQKLIVYKDLLKEASLNKELLTLLLTSQTALVSGALGFYFGGKDND
ncbi:MAG: hypothetical protein NW214_16545 [Pseudanabaenaceae cyanobacterium bins.39]|nr:hypothetical protein [Pseudanabaenaceae cyanobacterium bins.39]